MKCSDPHQAEVSLSNISCGLRVEQQRIFNQMLGKKTQIKHILTNYTESIIALRLTSCRKGI